MGKIKPSKSKKKHRRGAGGKFKKLKTSKRS